jgi:hypothetical protein
LDPRPFVLAGKSYTSISAYFETIFPNDIFMDHVRIWTQYSVPTGGFVNIDGVSKAEDLPVVLRRRATDLFGQGNFTISVIGNTGSAATAGCSVDPAAES